MLVAAGCGRPNDWKRKGNAAGATVCDRPTPISTVGHNRLFANGRSRVAWSGAHYASELLEEAVVMLPILKASEEFERCESPLQVGKPFKINRRAVPSPAPAPIYLESPK